MSDFRQRLEKFLAARNLSSDIEPLTPDASTREYFRINWNARSAIACIYPKPFRSPVHAYLDVTNLFAQSGLPVAEIYDFDGELGVIVQEDFGDRILREVLSVSGDAQKEALINEAISLIAKIQSATPKAFELNSIASKEKFDTKKLLWELNFFKKHYFKTLRKEKLSEDEDKAVEAEFIELSVELEQRATVLCHRDFHAANLMLDGENRLRIIDHQDARIGAASYDLVSLLLDRVLENPPLDLLNARKRFFLGEREKLGLERIEFEEFRHEFRLMTVQRCLKAIGTFSYQSAKRGRTHFIQYIDPMFKIVLDACEKLERFPNLQATIMRQLQN